jgi:hypothetical protein
MADCRPSSSRCGRHPSQAGGARMAGAAGRWTHPPAVPVLHPGP